MEEEGEKKAKIDNLRGRTNGKSIRADTAAIPTDIWLNEH